MPAVPPGRRHRVVVFEDHPIFRDGLVQCLAAERDLAVVGEWTDGSTPAAEVAGVRPDVAVVDVALPGGSGIDLTARLREALPDLRVVMLTAHADPDLLFAAVRAGAAAYVLKHTPPAELIATLRRVANGDAVLGPEVAARSLRAFGDVGSPARRAGAACTLPPLSPREAEVLKLLATGETNRQIARRLFVSEETVKSHVAAILRKLEVSDRTRAAVLAVRAGLVDA